MYSGERLFKSLFNAAYILSKVNIIIEPENVQYLKFSNQEILFTIMSNVFVSLKINKILKGPEHDFRFYFLLFYV